MEWVANENVTEISRLDILATEDDPLARRDDSSASVTSYNPGSTYVRHDPGEQDIARPHNLFGGSDRTPL